MRTLVAIAPLSSLFIVTLPTLKNCSSNQTKHTAKSVIIHSIALKFCVSIQMHDVDELSECGITIHVVVSSHSVVCTNKYVECAVSTRPQIPKCQQPGKN